MTGRRNHYRRKIKRAKRGTPAMQPAGFFVKGTKGPLKEGELERAAKWARQIEAGS